MQKVKKILKLYNCCRVPQHDQTSSSWGKLQKILETLQLAAEWHSINKNQIFIKIKPVVPEKIAKKWRKFGNFTIGCRVTKHEQKSKFDQDQTSSSWEKCKSEQNFETLQLTAECLGINKNQSLIKIRTVVPEKNAKNWETFKTLQILAECHSINKNQSLIKIKPVVPEKNVKVNKILKLYNSLQSAWA